MKSRYMSLAVFIMICLVLLGFAYLVSIAPETVYRQVSSLEFNLSQGDSLILSPDARASLVDSACVLADFNRCESIALNIPVEGEVTATVSSVQVYVEAADQVVLQTLLIPYWFQKLGLPLIYIMLAMIGSFFLAHAVGVLDSGLTGETQSCAISTYTPEPKGP